MADVIGHRLPKPTRAQNITALGIVVAFAVIVVGGGRLLYVSSHHGSSLSTSARGGTGGSLPRVEINGKTVEFEGELRVGDSRIGMVFKNAQGQPVDVGNVKLALDMNMAGMVMHSDGAVTGGNGRYQATLKPQMPGDWMARLTYNGPQGSGEKSFRVSVK